MSRETFRSTFALPGLPSLPPNASQIGVIMASRPVTGDRGQPFPELGSTYRGNLYPTLKPYTPRTTLPLPTTFPEIKVFDAGIGFPRGDQGAQMLDRRPRADGDSWIKQPHRQARP